MLAWTPIPEDMWTWWRAAPSGLGTTGIKEEFLSYSLFKWPFFSFQLLGKYTQRYCLYFSFMFSITRKKLLWDFYFIQPINTVAEISSLEQIKWPHLGQLISSKEPSKTFRKQLSSMKTQKYGDISSAQKIINVLKNQGAQSCRIHFSWKSW